MAGSILPLACLLLFALINSDTASVSGGISIPDSLYERIVLSSENRVVKRDFLKTAGTAPPRNTLLFRQIRNIPLVMTHVCGPQSYVFGQDFFFSDGTLCSRGVSFYPQRTAIRLPKLDVEYHIDRRWDMLRNGDSVLLYERDAEFPEYYTPSGRTIAGEDMFGRFVDDLNRPVYPDFIYRNGRWEHVVPLREKFRLDVDGEDFMVQIISEQTLSLNKKEFLDITALRAGTISFDTDRPYLWVLSGKHLQGMTIPRLRVAADAPTTYRGRYVYELNIPGAFTEGEGTRDLDNTEISWTADTDSLLLTITIPGGRVTPEELMVITDTVRKLVPAFYHGTTDGGDNAQQ